MPTRCGATEAIALAEATATPKTARAKTPKAAPARAAGAKPASGLLDTNVIVHLEHHAAQGTLPADAATSAVVIAELAQGVPSAAGAVEAYARGQRLAQAERWFKPLPFDHAAARVYGDLVAMTLAAGRDPKPRRLDLMIAATAQVNGLPLYTENPKDFAGLEGSVTVVALAPPDGAPER
jgi:predicted nucleic acid-binding protein